jgi:hypothetical protein
MMFMFICRLSCLNARLACPAGLEPAALGLEGRCSIRRSYGHDFKAPLAGPAARGARIIRKWLKERQFSAFQGRQRPWPGAPCQNERRRSQPGERQTRRHAWPPPESADSTHHHARGGSVRIPAPAPGILAARWRSCRNQPLHARPPGAGTPDEAGATRNEITQAAFLCRSEGSRDC